MSRHVIDSTNYRVRGHAAQQHQHSRKRPVPTTCQEARSVHGAPVPTADNLRPSRSRRREQPPERAAADNYADAIVVPGVSVLSAAERRPYLLHRSAFEFRTRKGSGNNNSLDRTWTVELLHYLSCKQLIFHVYSSIYLNFLRTFPSSPINDTLPSCHVLTPKHDPAVSGAFIKPRLQAITRRSH